MAGTLTGPALSQGAFEPKKLKEGVRLLNGVRLV